MFSGEMSKSTSTKHDGCAVLFAVAELLVFSTSGWSWTTLIFDKHCIVSRSGMLKRSKLVFRRGSAPDPAGLPSGLERGTAFFINKTTPFAPLRIWCLDPRRLRRLAFGERRVPPKTLSPYSRLWRLRCFLGQYS